MKGAHLRRAPINRGLQFAGLVLAFVGELSVELEYGLGESSNDGGGGFARDLHFCRPAASAAAAASRAAPRTRRFSNQRASRVGPSRRIAVGLWKPPIKISGSWLVKSRTRSRAGKMPTSRSRSRLMLRVWSAPDRRGRRSAAAAAQCHRQAGAAGADRVASGLGRR
jgi:hypothetical protein